MLNNNVTFEARSLYKIRLCSVLGNGDIKMKFKSIMVAKALSTCYKSYITIIKELSGNELSE